MKNAGTIDAGTLLVFHREGTARVSALPVTRGVSYRDALWIGRNAPEAHSTGPDDPAVVAYALMPRMDEGRAPAALAWDVKRGVSYRDAFDAVIAAVLKARADGRLVGPLPVSAADALVRMVSRRKRREDRAAALAASALAMTCACPACTRPTPNGS